MFGNNILYQFTNNYGSFSVEELNYEGRKARLLFSIPSRAAQSGIALDNNPRLLFDYNQRIFELAIDLQPKNILLLGGGALTLATALINSLTGSSITVVEQNKRLIDIALQYFNYSPNTRLNIVIDDAKVYVDGIDAKFDLIILDIYDDFKIPEYFTGHEFANKLSNLLQPSSIMVTNCIAGLSKMSSRPLVKTYSSYKQAICYVRVVKAENNYPELLPQNLLILASKNNQLARYLKSYDEVNMNDLLDI